MFEVEQVYYKHLLYGPAIIGVLVSDKGDVMRVSRYLTDDLDEWDEDYWVIDAYFDSRGVPLYANGEGSRAVRLRVLKDELAEKVNEKVREAGLWPPLIREE